MTQQEAQEKFTEELAKYEQDTIFPTDQLPEAFNDWKREAMRFYAPSALKMVPADFEKLYNKLSGYNISEIGTLIAIMERATMKNLDMNFIDYIFYQNTIEKIAGQWKDIMEPETTRLQRKYQTMARLSQQTPSKKKTIPLGSA